MITPVRKYAPFAGTLIDWLIDHPDSTYQEIQDHLDYFATTLANPPAQIPEARSVIQYIRGELGPDTIICTRLRRSATYQVAASRDDAMHWVNERKKNIRNQIQRTSKAVDDIEAKFGSDHDLMMVKASLESALVILNASLSGTKAAL